MAEDSDLISRQLADLGNAENPDPGKFAELGRQASELGPVVEPYRELTRARQELAELDALLKETEGKGGDRELGKLVEEDRASCLARIEELQDEVLAALVPDDVSDSANAILEIRSGAGGDEASLFAEEMFRMYERFAQSREWRFITMSTAPADRGLREAIASVGGENVFGMLKFESGVHRVQRVPDTETKGRTHTSTITVAVMPEPNEALTSAMKDFRINELDLRIETMRASGAGGQSVNTTDSAVRITHIPTGTVVHIATERSQHQNKAKAMQILQARLWDMRRREEAEKRSKLRASLVGSGARTEKIRTYNFPQGRITDHRINLTASNISAFMDGDGLGEIVEKLVAEERMNDILNSIDV
ncbi:peptide chain release factor 1 [Hyaloraphidium curvatum]|nr:peptide chain release factor 1 [Hyaloraphidium curvatum]